MKNAAKVFIVVGIMVLLVAAGCLCYALTHKNYDPPYNRDILYNELKDGDYTYTVFTDQTCEVTKYSGEDENVRVPKKINGCKVISIGTNAFYQSKVRTVYLPDSVIYICKAAFSESLSLESIRISRYVRCIDDEAFSYCVRLKSIKMWDEVTSIGEGAFNGCRALTDITVTDAITVIEKNTFKDCVKLSSISLPENLHEIGDYAFEGCSSLTRIKIPDEVSSIGIASFKNCTELNTVTIGDNLSSLGRFAFAGTKWLESAKDFVIVGQGILLSVGTQNGSIQIPDGVIAVAEAFENRSDIESVQLPGSVTTILPSAFQNCTALKEIQIPDSVNSIGSYAFMGCSSLQNVSLPLQLSDIGTSCFNDTPWASSQEFVVAGDGVLLGSNIRSGKIELPSNVKYVGNTFEGSDITEVIFPESVIEIRQNAFSDCKNLKSVDFGTGLCSLESYAFADCSALSVLELPDTVISIGDYCFAGCEEITAVHLSKNISYIGQSAFSGCEKLADIAFAGQLNEVTIEDGNYELTKSIITE